MLHRLQEIQQSGYKVDISGIMSRSWELVKPQIGIFILFNLLAIVISFVALVIPFIGSLVSIVVTPVIMLCNFYALRKVQRGEQIEIGTFFETFSQPTFGQAIIAYVVMTLIIAAAAFAIILPIGAIGAGIIFSSVGFDNINELANQTGTMISLGALSIVGFLLLFGALLYLSICYSLVLPVVFFAENEQGNWWKLMEETRKALAKNWGMLLLLQIASGFVAAIIGIFTLGLGIIVLMPWVYAVRYITFSEVIGFENDTDAQNDIAKHFVI